MRFIPPKIGTEIWKRKFAFFPKKIGNTIVWFETYYICRKYMEGYKVSYLSNVPNYWQKSFYLNDSEQVKAYILSQSPLAKALREEK